MDGEQKKIKVLHVDEESDFLALTKAFLERENKNFSVDTAYSAEEGIELLKRDKYDVVVADYMMPVIDGLAFLRNLRQSGNTIPFIMFTGKGREEVAMEALNRGANGYIQKGTDITSMFGTLAHVIKEEVKKKRAEDALRESEKQYKLLFESTLDGLFVIDAETMKVVLANQAATNLYGFDSVDDAIGVNPLDFVPPDERDLVFRIIAKDMFENDLRQVNEFRTITKDGRETWISAVGTRTEYQGRLAGLVSFRDITARKRMEEALRESEEKYRNLVERASDGIAIVQDTVIKYVNPSLAEAAGYTLEELIGTPFADYVHPDDLPKVVDRYRRRIAGEDVTPIYEIAVRRKDGSKLYVEVNASMITYQGKPAHFVIARDITERKRADEDIRQLKEFNESIVQGVAEAILIEGVQGNLTFANPAAEELLGYAREELIGQHWTTIVPKDELEKVREELAKRPSGIESRYETALLSKKGERIPVIVSARPLFEDGKFVGVLSAFTDITERKRVEERLRESEEKYRKQFEGALDAIFVADAETGIIIDCNRAASELVGREKSELIGKHQRIFHPPEEIEGEFSRTFEQHLKEKEGQILETQVITKKGEIKDVAIKANIFELRGKKLIHGIFRDITERKRAEEEIRREKRFSENIVATVPDSLLVLDTGLRVKKANRSFYEKFQTEPEKVIGSSIAEILGDKDGSLSTELTKLFGTEAILENLELHYQSEELGDRIFNITARGILVEEEEEEEEELVVIEDITMRKQMEEELRESEEEYRSLVESTDDSVYLVDRDSRYLFVNEKHLSRLGLSIDKIIGSTYGEFHSEEETKEFAEKIEEVFETGNSLLHEHRSRKDNRYILRTLSPVKEPDGKLIGVTIVSKDITERKRTEERQLQLLKELETVNNELKDFAYMVSHDLKAPLRAITALAEWLSTDYKDKLDEAGKERMNLLVNRAERMQRLIEGILQYSRVGRLKEEKEVVDFNTLVSEVITMINPPETIEVEVVNELPTIVCEKTQMEQVFQNLLSNAVKYMDKPKGKIRIGCTDEDGCWKFSVADNGAGIEEKYYAKIFQIFQTLKPRDEVESTGIGLSIVKKIVETQGGKIWVESKVGEGSTFLFTIPKERNKGGLI